MGIGHKLATKLCFEDKALGVALTPDLLLSNNCVEMIIKYYNFGYEVLFLHAIRYEKSVFSQIEELRKNCKSENLIYNARTLSAIAINSFHPETDYCRINNANFFYTNTMPQLIFESPKREFFENNGFIIHSLQFLPLFIDYSKISKHNINSISNWTIDGSYIHDNFKNFSKIKLINDSDEGIVLSWSNKSDGAENFLQNNSMHYNFFKNLPFSNKIIKFIKLSLFRERARSEIFDDLKRFFKNAKYYYISMTLISHGSQNLK